MIPHRPALAALFCALSAALLLAPAAAMAQTQLVAAPSPAIVPAQAVAFGAYGVAATPVSAANPLPSAASVAYPTDAVQCSTGGNKISSPWQCGAATAGKSYFVTDLEISNVTGTAANFYLHDGTGSVWWTSVPANTTLSIRRATPIKITTGTLVYGISDTASAIAFNLSGFLR